MTQPDSPKRRSVSFRLARLLLQVTGAALSFLLLLAVTLTIFGLKAKTALPAIADGAFGGWQYGHLYALSETFVEAVPLILTGLGVLVAWQAGMFSIGGEGQLLIGALAAMTVYRFTGSLPAPMVTLLMIAASVAGGALWGGIAGWLRTARNVQEVISTIMLNYIALYLVGAAVLGPLQEPSHSGPETALLPDPVLFAHILPATWTGGITARLHTGVLIALAAVPITAVWLYRTRSGFALRLTGHNADAARTAGFSIARVRITAMIFSGALCGLAGSVQLLGVSARLDQQFSPGWGYSAIPVALMGGLTPGGTLLSAIFFGALTAGTNSAERTVGVPSVVADVLLAAAVIAVVGFRAWRGRSQLATGGD